MVYEIGWFGELAITYWLIPAIIFALIVGWIAKERGRDPYGWGVLGFLLGFIALIFLVCTPNKKKD